jgi:hypothetical protein
MAIEHITITIETGNDAFAESPTAEIARILRDVADDFEKNGLPVPVHELPAHHQRDRSDRERTRDRSLHAEPVRHARPSEPRRLPSGDQAREGVRAPASRLPRPARINLLRDGTNDRFQARHDAEPHRSSNVRDRLFGRRRRQLAGKARSRDRALQRLGSSVEGRADRRQGLSGFHQPPKRYVHTYAGKIIEHHVSLAEAKQLCDGHYACQRFE